VPGCRLAAKAYGACIEGVTRVSQRLRRWDTTRASCRPVCEVSLLGQSLAASENAPAAQKLRPQPGRSSVRSTSGARARCEGLRARGVHAAKEELGTSVRVAGGPRPGWVEVTLSQHVDPKAPAYVVGIRESKWANRLRWVLFEQTITTDRVISCFRVKPVGQTNELTLNRDDFDWYPPVSGFEPVQIVLREAEGLSQ
jgi:hypothetical protein